MQLFQHVQTNPIKVPSFIYTYVFGTIFAHFIQKREQIMGYTLKKQKKSYIHLSISNIFSTFAGSKVM